MSVGIMQQVQAKRASEHLCLKTTLRALALSHSGVRVFENAVTRYKLSRDRVTPRDVVRASCVTRQCAQASICHRGIRITTRGKYKVYALKTLYVHCCQVLVS